jgi:hypothetical protein
VNATVPAVIRNDWLKSGCELSDKTLTLQEYQDDTEHVYTLSVKPNDLSVQREKGSLSIHLRNSVQTEPLFLYNRNFPRGIWLLRLLSLY